MNEKREEVRAGFAYIITCILILGGYAVFSAHNNIVLNVEAQGATSEDVIVKDVAPVSYENIPYITEIKDEVIPAKDLSVEEQIRAIAEEEGFKYPEYLVALARNESTMRPTAISPKNHDGTKDFGLFQFNDTNPPLKEMTTECAMKLDCATRKTIKAINMGYIKRWSQYVKSLREIGGVLK
jgi:hypothetical protein